MKILFVTYDLPYPLISGGKIRAYHLLKSLAENHELTLFSFYRDKEQKQYLAELKKYCRKIFLFKRRKVWSWENFWVSLTKGLPFAASLYWRPKMERVLKKELTKNHYDAVHFESFYPALFLPLVKKLGIRTVLGNENVEYQIYQRYAKKRFLAWRWIFQLEVFRMRLFEEKLWRQADFNLALSPNDAAVIKKTTRRPCPIIPNGVDVAGFEKIKRKSDGRTLIFVGTLAYQPNNDAMKYFLGEIYPLIKKAEPKIKFVLVSWFKPDWLDLYLKDSSISLIQDKETPAVNFLKKADILVAPIRIASGTNIKVLEAMAAGLAVVTTSIGIEGLAVNQGEEVIVADNPMDFSQMVLSLLADAQKRQKLALSGQEMVAKLYDWQKIGEQLNRFYQRIFHE